ncbi:MAG: PP0621 family protein [Polaromonas sp.]|uniref:PP0621 family protein n=1 Tax=Polaromonas sp. TaxID=1869339 RepID=UPI002731F7D8|nr:PP0621 family protein [Polaromonas sp.]MDP1742918.1 PP0621 family protein [Polaromonas sp.]MDP3309847.1 PP0621 family protein [Polaromonas sp.]
MKYLIVFAVLLVGIWLWRTNRRTESRDKKPPPRPTVSGPKQATEVVACAVCAVHLPRPDAVPGKHGLYCSEAHRRQGDA